MNQFLCIAFAFSISTAAAMAMDVIKIDSAQPECSSLFFCDGQFKLGAEWLYWQAEEQNLSPAFTVNGNSDPNSRNFLKTQTHVIEPDFRYSSGYRTNIGYIFPNAWEINAIYTRFPTHAKPKLIEANLPVGIGPYKHIEPNQSILVLEQMNDLLGDLNGVENVEYLTLDLHWKLILNQVDLDFARTIYLNDSISIRPHSGIRWLWYHDTETAIFTGRPIIPTVPSSFTSDVQLKNKFWGYGIEAGVWADWQMGCGLSLIGHWGGSILYSTFTVKESTLITTIIEESEITTTENTINIRNKIHTATPTMDYFLGLQYEDTVCDLTYQFQVGFEQHVYFNTNRFSQNGNFSTQGLTLSLIVAF